MPCQTLTRRATLGLVLCEGFSLLYSNHMPKSAQKNQSRHSSFPAMYSTHSCRDTYAVRDDYVVRGMTSNKRLVSWFFAITMSIAIGTSPLHDGWNVADHQKYEKNLYQLFVQFKFNNSYQNVRSYILPNLVLQCHLCFGRVQGKVA